MGENYFKNLVDAGAIKVKKVVPEWAKETLRNEFQYSIKSHKLNLLLSALEKHFSKKFKKNRSKVLLE